MNQNPLRMKTIIAFTLCMALLSSCGTPTTRNHSQAESEEWIQLFNGENLDGWTIKICKHPLGENFNSTFRVEKGMMVTRYDQYESFDGEYGHIFYKNPYSHYKLRVEYRVVGEQVSGGQGWAFKNSGVMFHAQSPESMGVDQAFPVSLEAQFLGGTGKGDRPTGNLCTPGTNVVIDGELVTQHCISSTSPTFHGEEWVTFELVAYGDSIIHHLVNGDTVLTYSAPVVGGGSIPEDYAVAEGTPVSSGYFAIQAESHPYDIRKVELLNLGD
ncbi:MAG: DUF1080 domain-containing protein [Bacteroidetes bacterium]|nr:DUF1080 domain-containing protein [Bacteroidota bacterium]